MNKKIIYLTNYKADFSDLVPNFIKSHRIDVLKYCEKITLDFLRIEKIDFIISDRYQYLLDEQICNFYDGKALNLHGSYCPYNRGYYPILWSILDQTPMGGTIFYINSGIDSGDILYQFKIEYGDDDTLRSCWIKVQMGMYEGLFQYFNDFLAGNAPRYPQSGKGTIHFKKEFHSIKHLLTDGWDTKIYKLKENYEKFKRQNSSNIP